MGIIARVGAALQELFGNIAEEAATTSGVIVRKRKFDGVSLGRTFVLGYLQNPKASDEALAQIAVQCGVEVTPQAIDQRHSPKLVEFLKTLFREATKVVVGSDKALAPILERFTSVDVLDSSTIGLPDSQRQEYPGCGGSHGGGAAAMKLQTELDLRSGALSHLEIEPGRIPDGASSRQDVRRPPGSLRITDLGYFSLAVFTAMTLAKEYFLSPLAVSYRRCAPHGRRCRLAEVAVATTRALHRSEGAAGQGQAILVSPDRVAAAERPSESSSSEIASRDVAQIWQGTHGATPGLV